MERAHGYDRDSAGITVSEFRAAVAREHLSEGVTIEFEPKRTNINQLYSLATEPGGRYKTIITAGEKASKEEKLFDSEGKALNYLLYRLRLHKEMEEEREKRGIPPV